MNVRPSIQTQVPARDIYTQTITDYSQLKSQLLSLHKKELRINFLGVLIWILYEEEELLKRFGNV